MENRTMTEDLKKEAYEYFKSICDDYDEELERTGKSHYWVGFDIKNAYLAGAEPREKRIEELEAKIEKMINEIDKTMVFSNMRECEICDIQDIFCKYNFRRNNDKWEIKEK